MAVMRLGDFYLDTRSQMGNRMFPPKFDVVVQMITTLLRACHTRWALSKSTSSASSLPSRSPRSWNEKQVGDDEDEVEAEQRDCLYGTSYVLGPGPFATAALRPKT